MAQTSMRGEELATILQSDSNTTSLRERLSTICNVLEQDAKTCSNNEFSSLQVWKLTDEPSVYQALVQYFQKEQFGEQDDPVCEWLYNWLRGSAENSPLRRFVSRFALLAVYRFFQIAATSRAPGLEAVLIAFYELQPASKGRHIDVEQPSVYHQPAGQKSPDKSFASSLSSFGSAVPPAVAAVLSFSMQLQPKRTQQRSLLAVCAADRDKVAAAALYAFNNWITTFDARAHEDLCRFCYHFGAHGRPWMSKEVNKKLQEQFDIALPSSLCGSPVLPPTPSVSQGFPLTVGAVQQMCAGLARVTHAAFARTPQETANGTVGNGTMSFAEHTKQLTISAAMCLHVASLYHLIPEAMLTSQAALECIAAHKGEI